MRARLPLVGALAVPLVLALGVGGMVLWRATHGSTAFAGAVALAPAGTARVGWTDWAGVRQQLGPTDGGASPAALDRLLDEAYDP